MMSRSQFSSLIRLKHLKKCLNCVRFYSEESFMSGSSSQYIEDMYNAWQTDPKSVHVSWDSYFKNATKGAKVPYAAPPNLAPSPHTLTCPPPEIAAAQDPKNIVHHLAVQGLIRSYQARGHLTAQLDPLDIWHADPLSKDSFPTEMLRKHELTDLEKIYTLPQNTFIGGTEKQLPLKEIVRRLEEVYCRHIGVEFMYIDNIAERQFIRQKMEQPGALNLSLEEKKRLLRRLIRTCEFENFLSKKWASEKRFGIEGCDMVIPGLREIIDKSSQLEVEHFFVGTGHRGRLNLLANIFKTPLYKIFNQFVPLEPGDLGSGDVKYHYGNHTERTNRITQKKYKLTILANPSHLEAVNPCVLGRCRGEQFLRGDHKGVKNMAILLHGDAAFSGQGVNYETLGLSYLPNYTTHGTISIIINNQIGFTTDPRFSRSSRYCSDLGRVVNAPVFHVNADDPESVIHVCKIAAEYRAKFHKDIVIDLIGYRKHGHNESDEPMFTQPLMYKKIQKMKQISKKYAEKLVAEKIVTPEEVNEIEAQFHRFCENQYIEASKQTQVFIKDWLDTPWTGFFEGKDQLKKTPTGVPESTLVHIAQKFAALPPPNLDFVVHKGIARTLATRQKMVENREIDWALGEALAFGSLLKEGIHVRLSGEDVERGTFSHRHHVLHHQTIDKVTYEPLNDLFPDQAIYSVCNSSLSEFGVLGFETGYAQTSPNQLVIWEAQFGDFFNTAQCIFDQFLVSGETKWMRQNGIVCLLPHGFEGMGSEHSSARIERFLQGCDDDPDSIPELEADFAIKQLKSCNWIIANCSTPANLFHILRRQVCLAFRKPLIIFSPKTLLRLSACRSSFDEMLEGTEFKRAIPESGPPSQEPQNVKKLIFCSGKIYYDIVESRKKHHLEAEIAICRVEQLSPFPYDILKDECEKYANAKIVWAQEEPKNCGGYYYCAARLNTLLEGKRAIGYVGRPTAASPATGVKMQHIKEVKQLEEDFVVL